jgi:hypothetical protein
VSRWHDPINDRQTEDHLSPLGRANEDGDWRRVAELAREYDAISVPAEARALVDALLSPRGLVLVPEHSWFLVVTLAEGAECAKEVA